MEQTDKYKELYERLDKLFEEVKKYASHEVTVCAATKTVSADVINRAAEHGLTDVGENRVQELLEKYESLDKEMLNIHFIGRLQTNKVKYIVDKVCMIQSVDSERLAREIDKQCKKIGKKMPVLAEVNIGGEESKGGVDLDGLYELCDKIMSFENLELRGIMIIPPKTDDKEKLCEYFSQSYEIFIDICKNKLHNIYNRFNGVLSMGMSGDYIEAMRYGSTMIRPGRAIFGERYYPPNKEDQ